MLDAVNDGDLRALEVATNRNRDAVGNYLFYMGIQVEISTFSKYDNISFHLFTFAQPLTPFI